MPNGWRKRAVLEYWDHDATTQVDWVIGACILVRRTAIEEIGLKDENYPIFHEETDWCYRLKQAGWETWFLHDVDVTHFGSQTVSKLWGKGLVLEFYKGKHRFIRKHYGLLALIIHRFLLSGMLLTRLIFAAFRSVLFRRKESRDQLAIVFRAIRLQMGV
jgi:GT2 family glycosyltransferase